MKSQGFSLTEMLISLFLASIIMAALFQVYWVIKRDYTATQKILDKQFDILWVTELLADSIRRSGFTPCMGIEHLITKESIPTLSYSNSLQSITSHRMGEDCVKVLQILSPSRILVPKSAAFDEDQKLLVADCYHAEIHTLYQIHSFPYGKVLTLTTPLIFNYPDTIYAGEWIEETWFIKNNAKQIPTLFYKHKQTEELTPWIQGVHTKEHRIKNKRLLEVQLDSPHMPLSPLYTAVLNS